MFILFYNMLSKRFQKIFKKDIYSLAEKGEIDQKDIIIDIR